MNPIIVRDFIAYLPARIIPAIAAMASIPIITRLLSPADYGAYLLALATLMLIGTLSSSWIGSTVVRFRPIDTTSSLAAHLRPFVIASIAGGVAAWLFISLVYEGHADDIWLLGAGSAWVVAFTLTEYTIARYRADERALRYSAAVCLRSVGGLIVGIALVYGAMRSGSMLLLGTAIASLLVVLPLRRRERSISQDDGRKPAFARGDLVRYAVPIALSNFFISALSLGNRYVVEAYWGAEQVAIYGAAYDIAERSIFLLNAMMLLSTSVLAIKAFEGEGETAAARMLTELLRFYMVIAGLIVTTAAVLPDEIVWLLLPPSYSGGAIILPIVSLGAVMVGIMHRYSLVLSFHKRTDLVLVASAIALAANIGISTALIAKYGIVGGAIGSLCGYAVFFIAIRVSVRKFEVPRFPWLSLVRILVACAAAGAAMHWLAGRSLLQILMALAAGAAAYAVSLLLTRELSAKQLVAAVVHR